MGELEPRKRSAPDDQILRLAGTHSPHEISREMHGILSPAAIAARLQTLLKAKNWLTLTQERALTAWKLKDILRQLEEQFLSDNNAKIRVSVIKEITANLDRAEATTNADLDRLYGNQAIIMGQVIERALQMALSELGKNYPDIDETDLREVLRVALPEAAAEIQMRTADEV